MPHRGTVRAYAGLAVGVIAISWSAIFVRWTRMPGVASAFYRVFFACVALWPILFFSRTKLTRMDRSTFWLGTLGGVFFAGDIGLYNIAVLHTSAGGATFLGNNAPLVVGLLTWAGSHRGRGVLRLVQLLQNRIGEAADVGAVPLDDELELSIRR